MDLTSVWPIFHGIDVGVDFYLLIDVGVAVFATRTSIWRNPPTRTSIPRKATHTNVNLEESVHADAKPGVSAHADA